MAPTMLRSRPSKPGNIAIQRQVFAVFVMAAVADAVTHIVKKGAGFELHASLRGRW